jgi:regulator of protease activity HflC (stomatin/prohibitin superfamily)
MKEEKVIKVMSGYLFLFFNLILFASILYNIANGIRTENGIYGLYAFLSIVAFFFLAAGYFLIYPNQSAVLTLFGKYIGTVKDEGFKWANPFYRKKKISLRARNLNGDKIKVNDQLGNPIIIAAVVVWRVLDTAKAAFEVDDFEDYVNVQSEAAVRQLAGQYPYDAFDDDAKDISLRDGGEIVNGGLEAALSERLDMAGIEVIEARISHLAYSSEIAQAMLQRQQATAIVAARMKIVEGAVSMVEMALEELSKKDIVELDEEKKAAMVSNLMIVLCSDNSVDPVINTGTLHQ